ncbi:hypothetical protein JOL79_29390 [Microbispora sp. RL4-1S]|uniref:Oxygen sensor histidine kinase NreB n=1 Tax=Microbispora oryzae TaxID=2806554 RepID=A0A940WVC7_9ACTN|nr:ATP-binding protein [Microbispora oryzae]MBP2707901.1 hypothetical protein [Microbispora oryzae]
MLVATGLEESLSRRIREAADAYHSFLLNQVFEAQESERRRIARELHDRIGHGTGVAHQQLALAEAYRAADPARASAKIVMVQQAIREIMDNLRLMTSELHRQAPVRNLEKSLLDLLEAVEDESISVVFDVNGDESWVEPAVLEETFLILREAVRNALNHGAPTMVLVRVDIAPHQLTGSIQDNGRGFGPARVGHDGVGLMSMRERAELLGGTVIISSEPGAGCLVELFLPLRGSGR